MATIHLVPADLRERYHVKEWRNAAGVLATASPVEWQEIIEVLRGFTLLRSEIVVGGGNRSLISRRIDGAFYQRGWVEKGFKTSIHVDDTSYDSPTHAVDCYKAGVAVEMEWNNKDPFFDRDLNNFRLLLELRAIHVGIIITRSWELQRIFQQLGKGASYARPRRTTRSCGPRSKAAADAPFLPLQSVLHSSWTTALKRLPRCRGEERGIIPSADALWSAIVDAAPTASPISTRSIIKPAS